MSNSVSHDRLSSIEREVAREIRVLRKSASGDLHRTLLTRPERLAHHFIVQSHGNVQLRIKTLAQELGIQIRTLERNFATEYKKTLSEVQLEVRLKFSCWLLTIFPPTKIIAIAALLGYERVQDFNRFFKKHMHQSPSEWGRNARAKIAGENHDDSRG